MKQLIMKRFLVAGLALLSLPSLALAQDKEKEKDKKEKQTQTIVITREAGEGKTIIEIDGDKVKVNGKDASESKDVTVNVTTMKGHGNVYRMRTMAPGAGTWSMDFNDDMLSLFEEDSNRGMLGVQMEESEKGGAEVKSVVKESAAEKAGIRAGDVITRIGDRKIESADDVTNEVKKHKPGDKLTVVFTRDGKEQKATAELTKWKGIKMGTINIPGSAFTPMAPATPRTPRTPQMEGENFNFFYQGNRPKLGVSIQDTEEGKGVKVLDVEEESNAAKAGIQKNDVILSIDGNEVKSTDEVSRLMRANKDKFAYQFKISRNGKEQTVEVKMPRKLKTADL